MNCRNILAFANAERRITARLKRYWAFLILAFCFAIGMHLFKSAVHAVGSSVISSLGLFGPRYGFYEAGVSYLTIFSIGVIVLAFDIRSRDTNARMVEILDSRPYSNLELILGRFAGILLAIWVPLVLLEFLIQGLGWILPRLGIPVGTVEPVSLFSFPLFFALPTLAFCCAIVMLIALLVRYRVVAMVLSGGVIYALLSIPGWFPYSVHSSFDLIGLAQTNLPSDLSPSVSADWAGWLQRISIVLLSVGMLVSASLVHPRPDETIKRKGIVAASVLVLAAAAVMATVLHLRTSDVSTIQEWATAHQSRKGQEFPDVISIAGEIDIEPGDGIRGAFDVAISAPEGGELDRALFSLNPGFEIERIADKAGRDLEYRFENGLLDIELIKPLGGTEHALIRIAYRGAPDVRFAYLDSATDFRSLTAEQSNIKLLGTENAIFERKYVALMPGIHWLPASGVDIGRDDGRLRSKDFYRLSLNVTVPQGWLVAGPGLRVERAAGTKKVTYGFLPETPVPEAAVIAAPFKAYSAEIEGIRFELLLSPDHDGNIATFSEASEEIRAWITDSLKLAKDAGLVYPFKAFSLVEVPNTLRGYAGGWRMDTTLSPPAMVLVKESSMPTARFDFDIAEVIGRRGREEQATGEALRARLIEFFRNDFTGGNVFAGIARSFFNHQTAAVGPDSIALDYVLQQLVTSIIADQRNHFSVARVADVIDQSAQLSMGSDIYGGEEVTDRLLASVTSGFDVWEAATTYSLDDIEPWDDPAGTVDLLGLKGGGVAELLYDVLGPTRAGRMVERILSSRRGGSYTRDDVIAAGREIDAELGILIDDWFTGTGLAGFVVDDVELYQLPSEPSGNTRYQLKLVIRNDEPVTGFARVSWLVGSLNPGERQYEESTSEPIRVPASSSVEYGVVLSRAPVVVNLRPYLSLNRESFLVKRYDTSHLAAKHVAPVTGVREAGRAPVSADRIVVDDLDPSFQVASTADQAGGALAALARSVEIDQGLPVGSRSKMPHQWSRRADSSSWGKYRHTLAYIGAGDGEAKAIFTASIEDAGTWELEIHLPQRNFVPDDVRGNWQLAVVSNGKRESVTYDAGAGTAGWNLVGGFELAPGTVSVELSNETNGEIVIADAVAWQRRR